MPGTGRSTAGPSRPSSPAPCEAGRRDRCPPRAPRRCLPVRVSAPCPVTSRRRSALRLRASWRSRARGRSDRACGRRAPDRRRRWRGAGPSGCRRGTRSRARSASTSAERERRSFERRRPCQAAACRTRRSSARRPASPTAIPPGTPAASACCAGSPSGVALLDPSLDQRDLIVPQTTRVEELTVTRFGQPRRHGSRERRLGDLASTRLCARVVQQTEGRSSDTQHIAALHAADRLQSGDGTSRSSRTGSARCLC